MPGQLLQQLERHLLVPSSDVPFGRVDVDGPLPHVLVRARTRGRPSGSAGTSAANVTTEIAMIIAG